MAPGRCRRELRLAGRSVPVPGAAALRRQAAPGVLRPSRREVRQLAELLRSPAEQAKSAALLVVGPSGCGKSSLVRAGLLHIMANEPGWRTLPPILPGADPVRALARELAVAAWKIDLDWTVEHVTRRLDESGLTALADELLRPALSGPVQVVGTVRPEFLGQLLGDSQLASLPTTIYPLRPLAREALRLVIEGPARLAGISVDDHLVARLVEDTASDDGTVILWDLTRLNDFRNHATERACSLAGRGLDRAEWARYVRGLGYRSTCPG
ncbi:MAG: hypothetical protein WCF33_02080 [Pseudonocardiaceae bacterium]